MQTQSGTAQVNGTELYYEIGGTGPTLVLISGLGQSSLAWNTVVTAFRQNYRTLVFDNRGTGRSAVPPGPYSINQMADDTAALIRHLGLGPVALVGWSMGGSILQSMLSRHRDLLRAAVLLNALPNYTRVQHYWLDGLIALRRSDAPPEAKAALSMPWAVSSLVLADHERTAEWVQHMLANPWPTSNEGFEAQAAGLRLYDSMPHLGQVSTPCMVLVGADDVLTPVAQASQIARAIPGAHLEVMGKGGHSMVLDYPHDVHRIITTWLSRNDTAAC
jgi:3-oxoadipate enol-lactonase